MTIAEKLTLIAENRLKIFKKSKQVGGGVDWTAIADTIIEEDVASVFFNTFSDGTAIEGLSQIRIIIITAANTSNTSLRVNAFSNSGYGNYFQLANAMQNTNTGVVINIENRGDYKVCKWSYGRNITQQGDVTQMLLYAPNDMACVALYANGGDLVIKSGTRIIVEGVKL